MLHFLQLGDRNADHPPPALLASPPLTLDEILTFASAPSLGQPALDTHLIRLKLLPFFLLALELGLHRFTTCFSIGVFSLSNGRAPSLFSFKLLTFRPKGFLVPPVCRSFEGILLCLQVTSPFRSFDFGCLTVLA